jgi:V-type H+-transporting ATPase proteolipid subunit
VPVSRSVSQVWPLVSPSALSVTLVIGMILILIFAEVLGLYGLIVALILNTRSQDDPLGCMLK